MKDVFGKTPVKFFYDRVHLNTLVYNKYERCEPFPEKNGFSRLGGGAKLGTNNSYRSYKRKNRFGNKLLN